MPTVERILATFVENWEQYQAHLASALALLTPEQFNLKAAPHLRSLGTIAAHIAAARAYWFHAVLGEGNAEFGAIRRLDEKDTYSAGEIVHGLQSTWAVMRECMARWTPAELAAESYARTWRGRQYMLSREWVVWHLLEHDLHHGGEVSLLLGMHGLAAPDV